MEYPTLTAFWDCDEFVRAIVGPVGSGKSAKCIQEILRRAMEQHPGPDGVRRTRWAIIRNTYGQLRDTTRKTFEQWIPDVLGEWREAAFTFEMRFAREDDGTPVHCEVLFRALDRPEDVKKLLSLELTGAYINEAREIPKHVLDVLETRVGRYPSKVQGGPTWFGIWMDTNPWHTGHWGYRLFSKAKPEGYALFEQPGGREPDAENVENLPPGYYPRLCHGKDSEWVASYVDSKYPSSDVGSIWGAAIGALEKRGGVSRFDHSTDDVFTVWDLGKSDSTSIWFWRLNGANTEVLDYYENQGQGLDHYFGVVESKPFAYLRHWLPHDAVQDTLAAEVTVLSRCMKRWPGRVELAPKISLKNGVEAGRWLLEQPGTIIHSRCSEAGVLGWSGVEALREYKREYDEETKAYSDIPLHDWASHGADAWRYLAVTRKHAEMLQPKPPPAPVTVKPEAITMAAVMKDAIRRNKHGGRLR